MMIDNDDDDDGSTERVCYSIESTSLSIALNQSERREARLSTVTEGKRGGPSSGRTSVLMSRGCLYILHRGLFSRVRLHVFVYDDDFFFFPLRATSEDKILSRTLSPHV